MARIRVTDGVLVGEDTSDSLFIINNPGNAVPDVWLVSPNVGEFDGVTPIFWEAVDADGDELLVDLYYGFPDGEWTAIAQGLPNLETYDWNTYETINGTYHLKVVANDADTLGVDLSDYAVTIYNHHELYGHVSRIHGACNSVTLLPYVHVPEDTTGHDYRIEFNPISKGAQDRPVYSYDLFDDSTEELLLNDIELSTVYDGALYTDWSAIFHGISLKVDSQVDRSTFHYFDFKMTTDAAGCDAELSISSIGNSNAWAFRGSDLQLRWQSAPGDSLTLEVWDLSNDIAVPYAEETGDNWAFARMQTDLSPVYRPGHDRMIWVCGTFFVFDLHYSMTVLPLPGDVWSVSASGDGVPCHGNIFHFGRGDPGGRE